MPVLPLRIEARPVTEPAPYGLLETLDTMPLPPHGGMAGISYETDFCGVAHPWAPLPCTDTLGATKDPDDGIGEASGVPIQIYHLHECRLVGSGTEQERQARAERALDLGSSRALEEGFGSVIAADANFVDVTPGGTPTGVVAGLALLEQEGGSGYGGRRYIHADLATVIVLDHAGLVKKVGDRLETVLGSVIIAGPGYAESTPPSAPAAGARWMYATGKVNVWEQTLKVTETVLHGPPYDNEYSVLAERLYVPTYECFAAGAEILLEA